MRQGARRWEIRRETLLLNVGKVGQVSQVLLPLLLDLLPPNPTSSGSSNVILRLGSIPDLSVPLTALVLGSLQADVARNGVTTPLHVALQPAPSLSDSAVIKPRDLI